MAKTTISMGRRAAIRIRTIAHEMGRDSNYAYGWIAQACRDLGLPYSTGYTVIKGEFPKVETTTIERVCAHVGCSPSDLMEANGNKGKKNGSRKAK